MFVSREALIQSGPGCGLDCEMVAPEALGLLAALQANPAKFLADKKIALTRVRKEIITLALVKLAAQFPRIVEAAAVAREPHRIAFYLYDLAADLHSYWNLGNDRPEKRFIVEQDAALTAARLFLGTAIGQVIRNGLAVLGVEAVESM